MHTMANPWIVRWKPEPSARLRLFCFPYAGGGASAYRSWTSLLPAGIELCAVQLPGHESFHDQPAFTSMDALVERLTGELLPYLDCPFIVFGHSMGALIAFEWLRHLRGRGDFKPVSLVVSGHPAPQLPDPMPPIHGMPDALFLQELQERYEGLPPEILSSRELIAFMLPTLRADFELVENYAYRRGEPLECPVSIFSGLEDAGVTHDQLAAWRTQTRGEFRFRYFGGGHFYLRSAQSSVVASILQCAGVSA